MAIDLACFSGEELDALAKAVAAERALGLAPPRRGARLHRDLVFRDESGRYYALGISSLKPYRWDGNAWRGVESVPSPLEGPARLLSYVRRDPANGASPAKPALDPLSFLVAVTAEARRGYHAGELTLEHAETLIASFYAQDNAGRLWAAGAFTGSFYVYEEKRWLRANAPKPSAFSRATCAADGETALNEALYRFLAETNGAPPESLTAAWQPPATGPEPPPKSLASVTLADAAPRAALDRTQPDMEGAANDAADGRVERGRKESSGTPWWLFAITGVLVLLILGAAAATILVRPWDTGAAKRWHKLVLPIVKLLP
jgi:hypothetical protein